jgi:hypothetical protein
MQSECTGKERTEMTDDICPPDLDALRALVAVPAAEPGVQANRLRSLSGTLTALAFVAAKSEAHRAERDLIADRYEALTLLIDAARRAEAIMEADRKVVIERLRAAAPPRRYAPMTASEIEAREMFLEQEGYSS